MLSDSLKKAIPLYKTLLDFGFGREHSLDIIQTRYNLQYPEKQLLYRTIHPSEHDYQVFKKTFFSAVRDTECIIVDFYNTAITIAEAMEGYPVYRGSDGFLRDLAKVYGRSRKSNDMLLKTASIILDTIQSLGFRTVYIIAEKQVSFSGELMKEIRQLYSQNLAVETILTPTVDNMIIQTSLTRRCIVSSGDTVVIEKSERVIDIPFIALTRNDSSDRIVEVWRPSYA